METLKYAQHFRCLELENIFRLVSMLLNFKKKDIFLKIQVFALSSAASLQQTSSWIHNHSERNVLETLIVLG